MGPKSFSAIRRSQLLIGTISILAGLVVLAGWFLELPDLTKLYLGGAALKANAALAFVFLGTSLCFLSSAEAGQLKSLRVTQLLSAFCIAVGLLTLAEHLIGWNVGIDELLIRDTLEAARTGAPGRMAANTALGFVFMGIAIALTASPKRKAYTLAQSCALLAWLLGFFAAMGYLYEVEILYQPGAKLTGMAFDAALLFLLSSSAVLASHPTQGIFGAITGPGPGGYLFRRQLLPILFAPLLLGYLEIQAEHHGMLTPEEGTLIHGMTLILFLLTLTWRSAALINRVEKDRLKSLAQSEEGHRNLASENAALYQKAKQAVQAREETLALVSHDLRNPLGAILLSAGLLRRGATETGIQGPYAGKYVENILHAGERMNKMIEDLLNLSKMEAGRFLLAEFQECGINIVKESLEMMQPQASEKNIGIESIVADETFKVSCDRTQIIRALTNLISNAIKFTPEGGRIIVRAEIFEEREVCFSVQDTGPGIPEEHQKHIFDRYWQAGATARKGTGLGLAIAKGIIEAHGGRLWVESQFGRGATFYFTLPRLAVKAKGAAA